VTLKLAKRTAFGWPAAPQKGVRAACKNGTVVHYDGNRQNLANESHDECTKYWKGTRTFHINGRGWSDIGYSFGVCPHGWVFEGRGWGYAQAAQPGGNTTWTSVTFMGGEGEAPTAAQILAYRELRNYLRAKGMQAGEKRHKDFVSTSCPGNPLSGMVTKGTLRAGSTGGDWMEEMVKKLPTLGKGAKASENMQTLRALLRARSHPEVAETGPFDEKVETAVQAVQRWAKLTPDGIVGPKTWPALLRVH
jgi:hypothetical protein